MNSIKIEKSKLKLKKNFDFFSFLLQIYKKYVLKPNFIFKFFFYTIDIFKNQKNVKKR